MIIRKATPADIGASAKNAVAALVDDDIDEYLFPRRRENPAAYLSHYRKSIRRFASKRNCYLIVAELEPSDSAWKGKKEIVGHCQWYKEVNDTNDAIGAK